MNSTGIAITTLEADLNPQSPNEAQKHPMLPKACLRVEGFFL
jgi:hypothetical protein